jgi:hypothetical protein
MGAMFLERQDSEPHFNTKDTKETTSSRRKAPHCYLREQYRTGNWEGKKKQFVALLRVLASFLRALRVKMRLGALELEEDRARLNWLFVS